MPQEKREPNLKGSPLEWAVASVSGVIVAGLIGFLIFQAFDQVNTSPDPVALLGRVSAVSDGYRLEITATNKGGATAESVMFSAELRRGDRTVETADVTFNYLPAHSERDGAFIFANDPRGFTVVVQTQSYILP